MTTSKPRRPFPWQSVRDRATGSHTLRDLARDPFDWFEGPAGEHLFELRPKPEPEPERDTHTRWLQSPSLHTIAAILLVWSAVVAVVLCVCMYLLVSSLAG